MNLTVFLTKKVNTTSLDSVNNILNLVIKLVNWLTKWNNNLKNLTSHQEKISLETLYTPDHDTTSTEDYVFLRNISLPKLFTTQAEILDKPVTLDELRKALLLMPDNKSPGLDGYPVYFFINISGPFSHPYFSKWSLIASIVLKFPIIWILPWFYLSLNQTKTLHTAPPTALYL